MRIRSHADAVRTEMESSDALLERGLAARPLCLAWTRGPGHRNVGQYCKVAIAKSRQAIAEQM